MARRKRSSIVSILGWLFGDVPEPKRPRTRYKAGSKMAEIHARHMERVKAEEEIRRERAEEKRRRAEEKRKQAEEARRQRAEERAKRAEELAARAERGELKGAELADLMKRGVLRLKNPDLSPAEQAELAEAIRLSEQFHGTPMEVFELDESERRLPRYALAVGELDALTYEPCHHSRRGRTLWEHESGDMGLGLRRPERPLLLVDPTTRRPLLVMGRSKMRLDPDAGLKG